jgi:hypothetical protein
LPSVTKALAVPLVVLFVVLGLLVIWLMVRNPFRGIIWLVVLLLFPLGVVNYFYFNRRRCPECGGHLTARHEYYEGTRRYRIMEDCPHCQIAWDTGCDESDTRYS